MKFIGFCKENNRWEEFTPEQVVRKLREDPEFEYKSDWNEVIVEYPVPPCTC